MCVTAYQGQGEQVHVGPNISQHALQLSEMEQEKAGLLGLRHMANKIAPVLSFRQARVKERELFMSYLDLCL